MQSSKHYDSQFEVHTLPDWQPMELLQNWRDVLMSSHTSDQTLRGVCVTVRRRSCDRTSAAYSGNLRECWKHFYPGVNQPRRTL